MISHQNIQWLVTAITQHEINWPCIKTTSIILLFLTITAFLFYLYGIFTKVHLKQQQIPKMAILYKQKSGKYQGDSQLFQQMRKQLGDTFKISKYIAIFYDDPIDADPAKCRSIIGVAVNCGEQWKIDQFIKKYPKYSLARTRESKGYGFKFPLISGLSFWIASFKVYRKIRKIKQKKQDLKLSDFTIEIYDEVQNCWNKTIQVVTLKENFSDFDLWKGVQGLEEENQRRDEGMREVRQEYSEEKQDVERQGQEQNQSEKSQSKKVKLI